MERRTGTRSLVGTTMPSLISARTTCAAEQGHEGPHDGEWHALPTVERPGWDGSVMPRSTRLEADSMMGGGQG